MRPVARAVLALAVGCARSPPPAPDPPAPIAWIEERRVPLGTVDPGAPHDALRPLGPILGGRRVVVVGEATHGTREFFQIKPFVDRGAGPAP